jgi:predicted nuclease with RNAse H fold
LGRQVARLLREQGVDVVYVGTSPARPDSTTVLVRRGDRSRGREIAQLLGGARVREEPDSLLRVDVTVLLGADYRFPKGYLPL